MQSPSLNGSCSSLEEYAHAHAYAPYRFPRLPQETKDSGRVGGSLSWEWSCHHHEPWRDKGLGEGVYERKRGYVSLMGKEMALFKAICGLDGVAV